MPRKVDATDRYRMKRMTELYDKGLGKNLNVYEPRDSLIALRDPKGIVVDRKRPSRKKV